MLKLISLVIFGYLLASSSATTGVDVSQLVSTSAWSCLASSGYSFAIVRGYRSGGSVDPNVATNIQNARSAGFSYVDVYLFPCVPCGNAAGQMSDLVNAISGQNYGMIWIDVEVLNWGSQSSNQNFITEMIDQGRSLGVSMGIYTNKNNWSQIVGVNWNGASTLPLWYAHYDNSPSFGDFSSFGGWSTPSIKQYAGDKSACGVGVDLNWYP
uniref:lysozyme n=1 Tax=Arcella intermedia TaxID=1963864 RepID=A0A6B2LI18_9EUKA